MHTIDKVQVNLSTGTKLAFDEAAYVLRFAAHGDFDSDILKLVYSSLTTPATWLAHNMKSGKRVTKKVMPVLGGFQQSHYATERLWAPSHDGTKVLPV
jgi:oligopeptidase B